MKLKVLINLLSFVFSMNILFAQLIVKDGNFQPTGITNQGLVAGYSEQAGPYSIWNPDESSVDNIGGLAPGQGIGGQARFSDDGNFLSGTSQGLMGPEMSIYDRIANHWTTLGSLGIQIDGTVSGGFTISGDGKTVAGLSWADTTGGLFAYAHAVAWNHEEGLMDLGSLFSSTGRSTRANAASYDGKVIVGWQDFNGPWKSAVWKKNPSGGYFPNKYLLIDTLGNPDDEYNQLGECSCISADGKWIGGYGDYANNNEPWIWSKDSGVINLGTLPNVGNGFVSGMNADASIVVGWFDGQLFGDPQTPFIWTQKDGLQELNAYINNVLGYQTGNSQIYTANLISPDGKFVAGYGVDNLSFNFFTYRLGLVPVNGVKEISEANKIKVYPNPTANFIRVNNNNKAVLTFSGIDGKLLDKVEIIGNYVLDISKYAKGIYLLSIQSGNLMQLQKIVKE
jgi:hypothetical protein